MKPFWNAVRQMADLSALSSPFKTGSLVVGRETLEGTYEQHSDGECPYAESES